MVKKKSSLEINEKELMDFYGYSGSIGKFQLKMRLLKSWILHSIAYSSPHPGVTLSMQKARGIIIGKIVILHHMSNLIGYIQAKLLLEIM